MDGDEERSSGVTLCDDRPETEAEASGDAAPVDVEEELSAEPAEDAPVDDVSEAVTPAEDLVDDVPAPAGVVLPVEAPDALAEAAPFAVDDGDYVPVGGAAAGGAAMAVFEFDPPEVARVITLPRAEPALPRRGSYLRRGVAAIVGVGFVALAVTAFSWIAPSPEAANRRFVDAAQSEGHLVTSNEQQSLLVTAARKICDRRYAGHISDEDRRATALTSAEIGAVGAAFGADTRDFTSLALKTYCSR
ncbi:hypothetical protein [Pseudonocardia charpentierae]|uniref:DUF732 domain-containing protein n=1 Tax=Pseudonocardia charpentierae TaxID=3075545 RepID=A0ABU2NAK7_9PSEU|nr:hypothetical protein [Pseudonocardia sp. DSM 45834]MDT0350761.1 hypothetical protein [Pseudonocardia sp. DSM 45834]